MKRLVLAAVLFVSVAAAANASDIFIRDFAQKRKMGSAPALKDVKIVREARIYEIHVRAVRDFSLLYKDTYDAKWFLSNNGYFANFFKDGRNTKVVYDKRGNRIYQIISYTEPYLNAETRHRVKSVYYDHSIIGVHQFKFDTQNIYLIKMMDKHSKILTLKVSPDRIEETNFNNKK